jgi:hypothetical protein
LKRKRFPASYLINYGGKEFVILWLSAAVDACTLRISLSFSYCICMTTSGCNVIRVNLLLPRSLREDMAGMVFRIQD